MEGSLLSAPGVMRHACPGNFQVRIREQEFGMLCCTLTYLVVRAVHSCANRGTTTVRRSRLGDWQGMSANAPNSEIILLSPFSSM